ncbi:hypothetical protein QS306_16590 [Paraburkholderia bonniea]|uniref:hypothetical protein n=1 Tax=Paraburkholderia bonniea TaxID=2152891 RepID=UPI002573B6E2|nr:hypothetical protein [Paraburkholderia bonniea]WJF91691.1 hypothetical protein QS306_16590 [Paraburkholderia bonniea]WJF95010.1 hypothetical protein QS308_16595 [Paraburkholderia bonniea]
MSVSNFWRLASGVWRLASGVWRLASGVWRLASGESHSTARQAGSSFCFRGFFDL